MFETIYKKRLFWRLRALGKSGRFEIDRFLFRLRYGMQDEREDYRALQGLFGLTGRTVASALATAFALQLLDRVLAPYYQVWGIRPATASDYIAFLVAVATIGGLFIGLYYAGLSAIGSAMYARVPGNVRNLLAHERAGSTYMRLLSYLTTLSLFLLLFRLLGFERSVLPIPIATLGAAVGVTAFVRLGQRAFDLFDPTALARSIFVRLAHWLREVTAGGFRWLRPDFQAHAYRQASAELQTLETLIELMSKEPHLGGAPAVDLAKGIVGFLMYYESCKGAIPPDSKWYEQKFEHRDWYGTEDSTVSIAYRTGTTLIPKTAADSDWLEKRLVKLLRECLRINLSSRNYAECIRLIEYVDAYASTSGEVGRLAAAMSLVESMMDDTMERLSEVDGGEDLYVIALVDRLALIPISALLKFREGLQSVSTESLGRTLAHMSWADEGSLYSRQFPTYLLGVLQWLRVRLVNEIEIEDRVVTPAWYGVELLNQARANWFVDNITAIGEGAAKVYVTLRDRAINLNRPWIAAAIASRHWEFLHKLSASEQIENCWADISTARKVEGLLWSDFDDKAFRAAADGRQQDLVNFMARQSASLAIGKRSSEFPDYAGQFLHAVGEESFNACLTANVGMLREIFPNYLIGCLLRYDSLRPAEGSTDWRAERQYKLAAAALMDLMDVSGYAKLFSELHRRPELWEIVKNSWDKYLEQHPRASQTLPALIALTESGFEIPHRGVLRTNWKQRINGVLHDLPRKEDDDSARWGQGSIDHESALVRVFATGRYGTFLDGLDALIGFYFRSRPDFADAKYGRKRRDIRDAMKREARRGA